MEHEREVALPELHRPQNLALAGGTAAVAEHLAPTPHLILHSFSAPPAATRESIAAAAGEESGLASGIFPEIELCRCFLQMSADKAPREGNESRFENAVVAIDDLLR